MDDVDKVLGLLRMRRKCTKGVEGKLALSKEHELVPVASIRGHAHIVVQIKLF